ncbi:hypothetical protein TpMuguga_01g00336 [Theileria parva strain Muguga]|uniref:SfiI-subtelomeric related protein family member n=1 Tax=Theileria parva TaxID=5875 RepID=Q4N8X8_THEPA|nr:uncharacterized protein TpMuguga_01g00336 [Theileria parva strain Muguga]EAN33580.1 hypothetical protein TpMuguga_01g00336 [Theileria parva strain Muguga]|eukprot:XP_765863.1 hypothetical protein [Theileria parva strain Muguga]
MRTRHIYRYLYLYLILTYIQNFICSIDPLTPTTPTSGENETKSSTSDPSRQSGHGVFTFVDDSEDSETTQVAQEATESSTTVEYSQKSLSEDTSQDSQDNSHPEPSQPEVSKHPISLDISQSDSADEYDCDKDNDVVTYTPKEGYVLNKIVKSSGKGSGDIWSPDSETDYPTKVVTFLSGSDVISLTIYLSDDKIKRLFYFNGAWSPTTEVVLDVKKTDNTNEYDCVKDNKIATYTLKDGYVSNKIIKSRTLGSDEIVWESETSFATKVVAFPSGSDVNNVTIYLYDGEVQRFIYSDKKWIASTETTIDIKKTESTVDYECVTENNVVTYTSKGIVVFDKIIKSSGKGSGDIWRAEADYATKVVTCLSGSDVTNVCIHLRNGEIVRLVNSDKTWIPSTEMVLDIKKTDSTNEFVCVKTPSLVTYTAKEGFGFNKIKHDNDDVWEDEDEYCIKVECKVIVKDISDVIIHQSDGDIERFIYSDKTWIPPTEIVLDIKKTDKTYHYNCVKTDNLVTYTANEGYGFNKIKHDKDYIWESGEEFCTKVECKIVGSDIAGVTIHLPGGAIERFIYFNGRWSAPTEMVLDIKKTQSTVGYECVSGNNVVTYTAKKDYGFIKITRDKELVWEYDDSEQYCVKVELTPVSNFTNSSIHLNNGEIVKLVYSDKRWVSSAEIVLDIKNTDGTSEYDCIRVDTLITYTPKNGHEFGKIKHGNHDIWESGNEYPTLVRLKENADKKYMVLLFGSKKYQLLYSDGKSEVWSDISYYRHNISNLKMFKRDRTELDSNTYKLELIELFYVYRYDDDDDFQPLKGVYVHLVRNNLYIMNKGGKTKNLNVQQPDTSDKPKPDPSIKYYKPLKLDFGGLIGETDTYEIAGSFGMSSFNSSKNHAFTKVSYSGKVVWEAKKSKQYAKTVITDGNHAAKIPYTFFTVVLLDDTRMNYTKSGNEWVRTFVKSSSSDRQEPATPTKEASPESGKTEPTVSEVSKAKTEDDDKESFNPDVVKLFTMDSSENLVELSKSKYQTSKDRDECIYDLEKDAKCHSIKYQDKTVWELESGSQNYPLYVTLRVDQNKFVVTFEDKFVTCTLEDGEWKGKVHSLKQGEALPESKEMTEVNTTVLDLNDLQNTETYTYSKTDNVLTFTPKNSGVFSGVIRTTGESKVTWTVIWQIQGSFELANSISFEDFGKGKQVLILDTRSGQKMLYKPNDGGFWKEVSEQPQNAFETTAALLAEEDKVDMIEIDIKDTDGKGYDYLEENTKIERPRGPIARKSRPTKRPTRLNIFKKPRRIKIYRPETNKYKNYSAKEGKGIRKVKDSDDAEDEEEEDDDDDDDDEDEDEDKEDLNDGFIWFSPVRSQYATHVSFKDTVNRYLAILLKTGNPLIYNQSEDDEDWKEITAEVRGDFFKLSLFHKDEDNKYRVFKSDQYTPSLLNLSYVFTFDKDVDCHKINYDGKTVWSYEVDKEFGSLKQVHFGLITQDLFIVNVNDVKKAIDKEKAVAGLDDSTQTEEAKEETETEKTEDTEGTKQKPETEQVQEQKQETPQKEPEKQLNFVQLDLSKTTTSNHIKYRRKNEFATFRAKPGCLFNKVIKSASTGFSKEEVFWEAQEGSEKYVKMVRMKLTDNHSAFILNTGELILFHKPVNKDSWEDITPTRNNFSGFKFLTFDQDICEYKELNSSGYTLGLNEFSYGVSFNVQCHLIKHENKLIYNYETDQEFGTLKGLYLGLVSNKFFLTNLENDNKTLDLTKEVSPPKYKKQKATELKPDKSVDQASSVDNIEVEELPELDSTVNIPSASLMTLNIESSDNTAKYQCSDNGIYKTFTARHGNGFNEVKIGTKTFWKSHNNDYGIKVRLKESSTHEKYVVILLASKNYLVFHSPSKDKPLIDYTDTNHSFYDIKLFSKDSNSSVYKQLDTFTYNVSLYHLSLGYSLKESVKCYLIKFGDIVVYKYDDHRDFGYIKGVYHDIMRSNLYILNRDEQIKVLRELDRGKTVTIDMNKTESTDEFECFKEKDRVIFTPTGTGVFDKLVRSSRLGADVVIWRANDVQEYSKKIVIIDVQTRKGKTKNVALYLCSGDIKHLAYSDGKWIETPNKVSLYIKKTNSTDEFEFSKDKEFKTFQARHVYLFNKIVDSASSDPSQEVVFEPPNPAYYSTKVVFKDSPNKQYLALLRTDDNFLLLNKPDRDKPWQDVTLNRLNLSDLKMFYYDVDTSGYRLLKDNQYSKSLVNFFYWYEFNLLANCHLIKFKSYIVWNHDSDPNFQFLKGVCLDLYNNHLFVVNNNDVSKKITPPNSTTPPDLVDYEEEDSTTPDTSTEKQTPESLKSSESTESSEQPSTQHTLVELDLTKTETTRDYEYEKKDDNYVFTAKSGVRFSKVKKGEHDLKESLRPSSPKVVANYGQAGKIMLYVYSNDKDFELHIVNDPEPSSHDITALPSGSVTVQSQSSVFSEHLKLLALGDDGKSMELDDSKLKVEDLTHLVNYTFEPDTKCSEIKYNNKTVWEYDKSRHGRYYPSNILLNTSTNFLLLESQGHYQYYFTYYNDEWRCISGYKTQDLQPLYPDKLRIFTLNKFGTPVMDDATNFDKSSEGPLTTLKFKPESRCIDVKYEGDSIWSYNYKEHEDNYPTSLSVNTDEKVVIVDCAGIYRHGLSFSAGKFTPFFSYKSNLTEPIDPAKLKMSTTDSNGNTVELEESKYLIEQPDTVYKFNPGVKCTCVKYGETEVWKHSESDHKDKFPTSISFNNLIRKYLVVESSGDYRNLLEFENNVWKPLGANDKLKSQYSIYDKFDADKLTFFTIETKETSDGTVTSELVQIDYTKYTRENPSFASYKFKSGSLCTEITYDSVPVWKYNENEHGDEFPTTVLLNIKKSYIVVESSYLYRYVYSYYDKKWKELPFGFKTSNVSFDKFKLLTQDPKDYKKLVELDSSQYDIEYSPNVLAIKFNTNVKCTSIQYEDSFPWTYNRNEHAHRYPTAVIFNKSKSFLMVESSHYYRYLYVYQNKEWKPLPYGYTLKSHSSSAITYDICKVKLFTYDKFNNNKRVEMTKAHYDKEESDTLVRYNMNYLTNCTCLMYDDKVVWEHYDSEHGDKYPTTISLVKKKNYLVVESGYDYRYMFEFENGEWKLLPFSYKLKRKVDAVEIDKFKLYSSDPSDPDQLVELKTTEYEKKDSYNSLVFTIKENVKCTFVKYDNTDAWVHDSIEHAEFYPTRVVFTKNKNFLLVESGYNYRYLYTFHKGKWKQMPFGNKLKTTKAYKFDANKLKLFSLDLSTRPYELDYSKFRRGEAGHILTHNLKPGVKCAEVRYDNISAWKHEEDEYGSNYPTTIIFNRNNGFLIVESKDNYESYHSYYDNKWHSVYGYKASKLTKNKEFYRLKLYETNEDGLSQPITGFHEEIIGPVITCNIFYGVKCTQVKYDELSVWSYDSDKNGNYYPTSVVFNIANSTIKVECEDQYVHFSSFVNEEWKPFSGFRSKKTTGPSAVKLFKTGSSGNYVLINSTKYNVNWDGENQVYEYDLSGVFCTLVKHDNNPVWTQRATDNQHPKSLTYNSDQKKFVLRFEREYIFCSFEDNEWKTTVRRYGTQLSKSEEQKAEQEEEESQEADEPTDPEKEDKSDKSSEHSAPESKFDKASEHSDDRSSDSQSITSAGSTEQEKGKLTSKVKKAFSTGKKEEKKHSGKTTETSEEPKKHSEKTTGSPQEPKQTSEQHDQSTEVSEPSQPYKVKGHKIPITLDISKLKSTSDYDYSSDADLKIFSAKDTHAFNKVQDSETVIWEAKDPTEYSLGVALKEPTENEKDRYLSMIDSNANLSIFHKPDENKPWEDLSSTRHKISDVKLLKEDDSEFEDSDYQLFLSYFSLGYEFVDDAECSKIEYNNEIIYNYKDDTAPGYPKVLYLELTKNNFYLSFANNKIKKLNVKQPKKAQSPSKPKEAKTAEPGPSATSPPDSTTSSESKPKDTQSEDSQLRGSTQELME